MTPTPHEVFHYIHTQYIFCLYFGFSAGHVIIADDIEAYVLAAIACVATFPAVLLDKKRRVDIASSMIAMENEIADLKRQLQEK